MTLRKLNKLQYRETEKQFFWENEAEKKSPERFPIRQKESSGLNYKTKIVMIYL